MSDWHYDWHYETDYPLRCAMRTLAHNLAIVAACERAFSLGVGFGYEWATREPFWPRWESGCGKNASDAEEARRQPGAFADIYGDRSKWRAP